MRRAASAALALCAWGVLPLSAQDVFHSTQAANLPTAEIYPQGSWLFEISHRFGTPISNGAQDLWGLDGPVGNRLGLTYSPSDRVALTLQRSNLEDNLELAAKVGLWSGGNDLPVKVAAMGGVAWNTQVFEVEGAEDNEAQLYAQLIVNAAVGDRLAVGVVPTYLRNPRLRDFEADNALAVGLHGQLRLNGSISFLVEWLISEGRPEFENDAGLFGFEIETRGHFFKLLVGNQYRLNSTQFLAGTPARFEPDEWMFGFNIQRLLPF